MHPLDVDINGGLNLFCSELPPNSPRVSNIAGGIYIAHLMLLDRSIHSVIFMGFFPRGTKIRPLPFVFSIVFFLINQLPFLSPL